MRRKGWWVGLLVGLVIVAVLVNRESLSVLWRDYQLRRQAYLFRVGAGDARVVAEAYIRYGGAGCTLTIEALNEMVRRYPDDFAVVFVDISREEGRALLQASPLTCPGILINGQTEFVLEDRGQKTRVNLSQGKQCQPGLGKVLPRLVAHLLSSEKQTLDSASPPREDSKVSP